MKEKVATWVENLPVRCFKRLPAYWRRIVTGLRVAQAIVAKPKVTRNLPEPLLSGQAKPLLSRSRGSGFRKTGVGKSFGRGQSSARKKGAYSRQIFRHGAKIRLLVEGEDQELVTEVFLCSQLPLKKYCNFPLFVWVVFLTASHCYVSKPPVP